MYEFRHSDDARYRGLQCASSARQGTEEESSVHEIARTVRSLTIKHGRPVSDEGSGGQRPRGIATINLGATAHGASRFVLRGEDR